MRSRLWPRTYMRAPELIITIFVKKVERKRTMETNKHIEIVARKLGLHDWQVENTIRLMDGGATIPFISRYRKEMTGSLDEVQLMHIKEEYDRLKELDARRSAVIKSIEEQEKMTPELRQKIDAAITMSELEDIYLPYRPKRRTRATIAREKGLEPLAVLIMDQKETDPTLKAEGFHNHENVFVTFNNRKKRHSLFSDNGLQALLYRRSDASMVIPIKSSSLYMSKGGINPRRGDTLVDLEKYGYRYNGITFWNGANRICPELSLDSYGSPPLEFAYPEFPIGYFYCGHGRFWNIVLSPSIIDGIVKKRKLLLNGFEFHCTSKSNMFPGSLISYSPDLEELYHVNYPIYTYTDNYLYRVPIT